MAAFLTVRWTTFALYWICVLAAAVHAWVELPKFNQMKLLYPGYYMHGGQYHDTDIVNMIGGDHTLVKSHDTASLRMSHALNKYGGRHAIGTEPILLSKRGRDSITGFDHQEYIFRNTAFGPFLAARYGNPVLVSPDNKDHTKTMLPFHGKQGIVRLVSYHKHAGGHVALWDCDHFHESRDWTTETQIIGVEFWEAPDSYCPPRHTEPTPEPKLVRVDSNNLHVIERHNFDTGYLHTENDMPRKPDRRHDGHHTRHRHGDERNTRINPKFLNLWAQR